LTLAADTISLFGTTLIIGGRPLGNTVDFLKFPTIR